MSKEEYPELNAYEIDKLTISDGGTDIDIKKVWLNITFVEDIFQCAMSGSVLIKDAANILSNLSLNDYWTLTIQYRTPGIINSKPVTKNFYIVELTDRVRGQNERAEVYRLNFVSTYALKNKTTSISKSFSGKISNMVKTICNDYLGSSNLEIQETKDEHKFVIPRWSPFRTIEWLCARSVPAKRSKETNYMFFETVDGHNFITLSELVSQEPMFNEDKGYEVKPTTSMSDNANKCTAADVFFNPLSFQYIKNSQKLKELIGGAFSSILYTHDVVKKEWKKFVYNYDDDFKNVRHITSNKITKKKSLDPYLSSDPNCNLNLTTKQYGLMGDKYLEVQNHEEWLQRMTSARMLMDTIKVKLKVSGNSALRVGKVISLKLPKTGPLDYGSIWYDEKTSGKYLILTLRHTFTREEYTNTLLVAKNSYEEKIPDATSIKK